MLTAVVVILPAFINMPPADINIPPAFINMLPADINIPPADINMLPADINMPPAFAFIASAGTIITTAEEITTTDNADFYFCHAELEFAELVSASQKTESEINSD